MSKKTDEQKKFELLELTRKKRRLNISKKSGKEANSE